MRELCEHQLAMGRYHPSNMWRPGKVSVFEFASYFSVFVELEGSRPPNAKADELEVPDPPSNILAVFILPPVVQLDPLYSSVAAVTGVGLDI